jgi:hypothetical protein
MPAAATGYPDRSFVADRQQPMMSTGQFKILYGGEVGRRRSFDALTAM